MFKDRIEWLLKKNKMKSSELADRLNVSKSTVTKWTNGEAIPRHPLLQEMTNIFSVSIGYLLGEGDIMNSPPPPPFTVGYSLKDSGGSESYVSQISTDVTPSIIYTQDEPEPIDDFVWIPLYETKISATPGVQDIIREDIIGWHTAPKSLNISSNPLERPFSMRVTGDSMKPDIMPNDYITVKPAPFIIPDIRGVYAVKIEDKSTDTFGIVVKRVQFDEKRGIYLLRSDNPDYSVYIVDSDKATIIGKIVSIWRKL